MGQRPTRQAVGQVVSTSRLEADAVVGGERADQLRCGHAVEPVAAELEVEVVPSK